MAQNNYHTITCRIVQTILGGYLVELPDGEIRRVEMRDVIAAGVTLLRIKA